jgi:predicted transposase/invertase (TIGR01784 family)
MLSLDLIKHTRFYQEAKEEGRLEGILEAKEEGRLEGRLEVMSKLLAKGFTIQEVANLLDLDVETVREAAEMQQSG